MLPADIQINERALATICGKYRVAKLSLFGSVLRSDYDPSRSDIDVLVEFLPGARRSLQRELAELFSREVDVTTPGSLSKYFRDEVLATADVLYDAA
jgi:predicted nucleotidyltransferase